jgi:hypothetical protein
MRPPIRGRLALLASAFGAVVVTLVAVAVPGFGATSASTPPRARVAGAQRQTSAIRTVVRFKQGPRGRRGPRGRPGPQGPPGSSNTSVLPLTLNWTGLASQAGNDTASVTLPGIAAATIDCSVGDPNDQSTWTATLVIDPASSAVRTVASITTLQGAGYSGASSYTRSASNGGPITISLPLNGMLNGTISVESISGNGGTEPAPATLMLSSEIIPNDPNPLNDSCYVAAQFVLGS